MFNLLWLFKAKTIWSHWFKCMFNNIVTYNNVFSNMSVQQNIFGK